MKPFFNKIKNIFIDPKKCKKWGQICLVSAIILNAFAISLNLHLSSLQGELQNKRYDEQYYIMNEQTKSDEIDKYQLLLANSNQLVMLRRLADKYLTPNESNTVRSIVKELNYQSEVSKVNVAAISYLLANDPPEGTNPFTMFQDKSDSELVNLQRLFNKQAEEYANNLWSQKTTLMDAISFWQLFHSSVLLLSTIILIIGSILTYRSEFEGSSGS